ncbi:hypothetical protein [Dysgonomonas sp. 511]|uniref:hypothetical protein n=1 Tax=Dysgonomonas sp. 511 TaxID=2302930 RepID=UPI0013D59050|nr:hypothetical protein [Dysgonomonas sp. 511]NDV77888.1 hypothetical protein [Dysgonomonas sp. 511]
MKYQIYIAIAIIVTSLSSCQATYYYSTLNSTNEYIEKVDNGDFLLETDSLWIAHSFRGEGAPMQITIFNKLNEPLYVDWERSAMIIGGMAYSYTGKTIPFEGSIETHGTTDGTFTYSSSIIGGVLNIPGKPTFIPPQSMVSEIPLSLLPDYKTLETKSYKSTTVGLNTNSSTNVKRMEFTPGDTPMRFQSYLTLYYKPEMPMAYTQDFYMTNLLKTSLKPKDFVTDMGERGDVFYMIKPANYNALYTVLGVTALAGLIVVGVAYGDEYRDYQDEWEENWDY